MTRRPRIAITAGEPAGIGPDLCADLQGHDHAELIVIADPELMQSRSQQLNINHQLERYDPGQSSKQVSLLALDTIAAVQPGTLDTRNSAYVLESIRIAVDGCSDGTFDAMVTAPVHKGVINDAGIAFSGHTEYIAERLNATPLMLLVADSLRVALVTTHLPLNNVADAITHKAITDALQILHDDLKSKYNIKAPHILVCGLNPHAGESGHLGREEIDIISPAIAEAQTNGINVTGPLPADTLFTQRHLQSADAVLAMYHDQGLPVLKYAGFGKAVNITLGLPIIRTSVDHGTALDLAGTGKADGGSLQAAIDLAVELVNNKS